MLSYSFTKTFLQAVTSDPIIDSQSMQLLIKWEPSSQGLDDWKPKAKSKFSETKTCTTDLTISATMSQKSKTRIATRLSNGSGGWQLICTCKPLCFAKQSPPSFRVSWREVYGHSDVGPIDPVQIPAKFTKTFRRFPRFIAISIHDFTLKFSVIAPIFPIRLLCVWRWVAIRHGLFTHDCSKWGVVKLESRFTEPRVGGPCKELRSDLSQYIHLSTSDTHDCSNWGSLNWKEGLRSQK